MFPNRGGSNDLSALINRRPPSAFERFFSSPTKFIASVLIQRFGTFAFNTKPSTSAAIRVVCISDTHGKQPQIPPGDLLIHAGDLTVSGSLQEIQETFAWLATLPHRHKVIIAGNHDTFLASSSLRKDGLVYLQDSSAVLDFPEKGRRLKIYGSPQTPKHGSGVFQYPRSAPVWEGAVPVDIDVLVTHGPPFSHLDNGRGCKGLLRELWRIRPRLHVFGHIHAGYGVEAVRFDDVQEGFEDVCTGRGVRGLGKMVWSLLTSLWKGRVDGETSVLVNAAVVGGLRDEFLREAVVVEI